MKVTLKGYTTYEKSAYMDKAKIGWWDFIPSAGIWPDLVLVGEQSIEVDVPENFDPRPELIAGLKKKEQQARADFEKLLTDIQRQISQYEAISMDKPS